MKNIETTQEFEKEIENGVTLVDFYATWCGPCRMLAPFIEEIAEEYSQKLKVAKLDVDECGEVASRYGINAIPALLVFKDGELVKNSVGFIAKDDIVDMIEEVLTK